MNVLAVVAHPDDELMCAGTLARFAAEGHGVGVRHAFDSEDNHEQRIEEAFAAADALGIGTIGFTPHDEDAFKVSREEVSAVDNLIRHVDLIITHRPDDTNQTHATLARVVRAACRKNNKTLWLMDQTIPGGWDSTSPRVNHLVNITSTWSKKSDAVYCYRSQLERYPQWWTAIEARDRHYGWMLDQGNSRITHAEGFIVEKSVWL